MSRVTSVIVSQPGRSGGRSLLAFPSAAEPRGSGDHTTGLHAGSTMSRSPSSTRGGKRALGHRPWHQAGRSATQRCRRRPHGADRPDARIRTAGAGLRSGYRGLAGWRVVVVRGGGRSWAHNLVAVFGDGGAGALHRRHEPLGGRVPATAAWKPPRAGENSYMPAYKREFA